MLFNSFQFIIFFPLVCLVYFLLGKRQYRNPFLLVASLYFYMNWEPSYVVLILFSSMVTYISAILLERYASQPKIKHLTLSICLLLNFSTLIIFKYYNFINESVFSLLQILGLRFQVPNIDLLLPAGISFYTMQTASYVMDVNRGVIKTERNPLTYTLFVCFFPQLVAGPIEMAKNLLPQFKEEHPLDMTNVSEGMKQMLWGFFMKLCVADVLAEYVDAVYNNVPHHNGSSLWVATLLYTFQIYCDFAGYSNIAIGAAKVMGFKLMENFRQPYFSTSVKEFWRRWHISLSKWFTNYLYIPLGGNRVKYWRLLVNLYIVFIVTGVWHGANWTFVIWGMLHGIYMIMENIIHKYIGEPKCNTFFSKLVCMGLVFSLMCFTWIFFRAQSIGNAWMILTKMFTQPGPPMIKKSIFLAGGIALAILLAKDLKDSYGIGCNFMHSKYPIVRYASIVALVVFIMLFGALSNSAFIYFQF